MSSVIRNLIDEVVRDAFRISSGLRCRREYVQQENPSEEKQLAADVWANEILKESITGINGIGEFASEEEERIVSCGSGLSVTIDPLDGSSNLPTNNIVGTIAGIYDESLPCSGEHLVASFYVVYGPLTTLTVAYDGTVHEYALEEQKEGDDVSYYRTKEDVRLPDPTVFGFGGRFSEYTDEFKRFSTRVRDELKLRYGGALVGDANQVLHLGGIYGYPITESSPRGKLRLLYEANPIAFIFEQIGGASSDGEQSILNIEPSGLHQRTPLFFGNRELIDQLHQGG